MSHPAVFLRLCLPGQDWEGTKRHAEYSRFALGNELNSYRLFLGNYSGSVGNDALSYHNNTAFSTKDKDNDNCLDKCAQLRKGEVGGGEAGIRVPGHQPSRGQRENLGPRSWGPGFGIPFGYWLTGLRFC